MAPGAADAVRHGQPLALLRGKVVLAVGVECIDDGIRRCDLRIHMRHDRLRLRRAQRTGHEVILHIDYDK